nr:hypothetical protein [Cupriavidus sp. YR651]
MTRAYTEARHRGLIASFSGRGSFIAAGGEPVDHEQVVDLALNTPPHPASGGMAERVNAGLTEMQGPC